MGATTSPKPADSGTESTSPASHGGDPGSGEGDLSDESVVASPGSLVIHLSSIIAANWAGVFGFSFVVKSLSPDQDFWLSTLALVLGAGLSFTAMIITWFMYKRFSAQVDQSRPRTRKPGRLGGNYVPRRFVVSATE